MCFGKQKTHKPDWMDPLGPVDMYGKPMGEGTEAQRLRSDLYKSYESSFPQAKAAGNEAARVATQFGNDPIWSTSGRTLTDTAGGQFLAPNPYLQKSIDESRLAADTRLRNASEEARANFEAQQAATRSGFARNGVTFGTGATQGQDAARAAVEAGLARGSQSATAEMNAAEAARLADNYARERALQMQSAIAGPAAMAQRSASGSLAITKSAPVCCALLRAKSMAPGSSGFGNATVGKLGSGLACSVTTWAGGNRQAATARSTSEPPTPCSGV